MFTLGQSKYANELIKLGFSDGLYCQPEDCKQYLKYCTDNNMIWFNNSYGTIVHKDFDKYFKEGDRDKDFYIFENLCQRKKIFPLLDHVNFLQSINDENDYIITSSPYKTLNVQLMDVVKKYPYKVYIIHPHFLNYHAFILQGSIDIQHPLYELNYAFTNMNDESMQELNKQIYEDTGIYGAFVRLV